MEKESDENEEIDTTNMPDLESEESATEGKGIKILTPKQMLHRLPISLAQLKAGNNSEKPKNDIRQILYSLCRSKNLQSNSIKVWLTWKQSLWTPKIVKLVNHTNLNWI